MTSEIQNPDWSTNLQQKEEEYTDFYQHDVEEIKAFFFFVNKDNIIDKITEEIVALEETNLLKKEQIIALIHNNMLQSDIRYNVDSILKYNITLAPLEIKNFINTNDSPEYLNVVESIDDLYFEKTITSFYDLNSLFIIFRETQKKLKSSNTKKLSIKHRDRKTRKRV
jgi:hypothetical protein